MSDERVLRKDVPWLYFLARGGQMIGTTITSAYLAFYMTERLEISVLLMGSILLVSKVIDLITGMASGAIIQKMHPNLGKYRFWLLISPTVVAFGCTIMFINTPLPEWAKGAIILVGYNLYGVGMSFIQLAMNGLIAKISGPNMKHRILLSGRVTQGQNAGRILSSATVLPLIVFVNSKGLDGYTVAQVITAIISVLAFLPLFLFTKEFDGPAEPTATGAPPPASSISFGAMFGSVVKNSQVLILLLADILRGAANQCVLQFPAYFFTYVIGDIGKLTPVLTVQNILGFVSSLFMPSLARKIGKRNSGVVAGLFMGLAFVELAIFGMNGIVPYIIAVSIFMMFQALILGCGANLYLDCGEYHLYKTGQDARTFIMSMYGISIKLGNITASVVVPLLLALAGYQAATVRGGSGSVANVPRFAFLMGAVIAGMNLLYMLLMLCYRITEEKAKEYAEANHKRTQAA
jgi:Na+/melibiose symporter-like transporter